MGASLEVLKFVAGDVIAPDAYTRVLDRLSKRSERNRLCAHVRKRRGERVDRPYRRWLKLPETRALLEKRSQESRYQLIESLTEARAKRVFRSRTPDRAAAEELVDATFLFFLQSMDPSNAVAVSDARNEDRFVRVEEAIREHHGFDDALDLLPPPIRERLRGAALQDRVAAERLTYAVAHGEPKQVLRQYSTDPPEWIASAPGLLHLALAELQRMFGEPLAAARSYELTAESGVDATDSLANAASLLYALGQEADADTLIARARDLGSSTLVEAVATAEADPASLCATITAKAASEHRLSALLYAQGLWAQEDLGGAVTFLRDYLAGAPNDSEAAVLLARILIARAALAKRGDTDPDLSEALDLSIQARDERRRWRLPSGAAAAAACHSLLVRGWLEKVLVLGQAPPRGEATDEEAANPDVQFAVSQAAFALGEHDVVDQIAAQTGGFDRALLLADLAAATTEDPEETAELYRRAWKAATNDADRHSLWISAATAGIEPLPGIEQLPNDNFGTVIQGMLHVARDRPAEAVELLRPLRGDLHARATLTQAYLNLGRVDDAVSELLDMAEFSQRVEYQVRACEVLRRNDRIADAAKLAQAALVSLPLGNPSRNRMYEVLALAAQDREDWHDLERWARAWIAESGPNPRRVWLRAASLNNLGDTESAWRLLESHPELAPEAPVHAQFWITLASRYQPGEATRKRALSLVDDFPGQKAVRNAAVNAFITMGSARGEVSADEQQAWRQLIDERAADNDPDDYFEAIRVQEASDSVDQFRSQLEEQAQRVAEWLPKVREQGYPFGFLAHVTGRHYAQILVERGTEFLSVASPDGERFAREVAAAERALDRTVAVDTSSLAVGYLLRDEWPLLLGCFTRVVAPRALRIDATASLASLRVDATTHLSWDLTTETLVASEVDREQLAERAAHLQWVCQEAGQLPAAMPTSADSDQSLPEVAWTQAVLVSAELGCALWADDLGVRLLAEGEGVEAFGTWALLTALERRGRMASEAARGAGWKLRDGYCADLPLDPEWVARAGAINHWQGPELALFARPATWGPQSAYRVWTEAVSSVAAADEELVPAWVYAATIGVLRELTRRLGRPPALSEAHAGSIPVLHLVATTGFNPPLFARALSLVRTACTQLEVPDVSVLALVELADRLRAEMGMEEGNTALARLGSQLEGEQRDQLRRVLFGLDGEGRPRQSG